MNRLGRAWRQLGPEQRLAAVAALALLVTMFLPWYQQNAVDRAGIVSQDLDAFAVFSFLEATILLVGLSVIALLFLRAEGRSRAPQGSDGALVLAGGAWAMFVLFLRLFDKPGVESHGIAADVGVQWGIFFALAAAGLLTYSGMRMRATRPLRPLIATAEERAVDAWTEPVSADHTRRSAQAAPPVEGLTAAARGRSLRRPGARRPGLTPPADAATQATSLQLSFDDEESIGHDQPREPG